MNRYSKDSSFFPGFEIKHKKRKPRYVKSAAVRELEQLAMDEARLLHPTMPHLGPRTFRDDSANTLTACIVKYITLKGGFASRCNNQGVFNINTGRYIPSTAKKGLPDIVGTYQGKSLMIEVKYRSDKLSDHQEKIRQEQERSGGLFFIAHDFEGFKNWFDNISNTGALPGTPAEKQVPVNSGG